MVELKCSLFVGSDVLVSAYVDNKTRVKKILESRKKQAMGAAPPEKYGLTYYTIEDVIQLAHKGKLDPKPILDQIQPPHSSTFHIFDASQLIIERAKFDMEHVGLPSLSLSDCITLRLMQRLGVHSILSFKKDFDKLKAHPSYASIFSNIIRLEK